MLDGTKIANKILVPATNMTTCLMGRGLLKKKLKELSLRLGVKADTLTVA